MIDDKTARAFAPTSPPSVPPSLDEEVPAPARARVKPIDRPWTADGGPMATGLLAKAHEQRLVFTGTGAEYFRLWVVNTLLTLATLGVYSAWAKRRKARWFARHTLLAGEPFDFHGDPRRILVGRVLALTLLVCYGHAFEWSKAAGFVMLGVLYGLGPMLFAGAQRFKLGNTSWRGVRFGFQASAPVVYASCLPLLVAWTVASIGASMGLNRYVIGLVALGVSLLFPLAHGWLKRFQHRHARYGERAFSFDLPVRAFYGLYLALVGLMFLAGLAAFVVSALAVWGAQSVGGPKVTGVRLLSSLVTMGVVWVIGWPVYIARLQKLIWNNTRLEGGIEFRYDLPAMKLFGTLAVHGLLTVLTLGLYWPFLAVRLARLRVGGMTVLSDEPVGTMRVRAASTGRRGAAGDGVADAFGLDIGW